LTTAFCLGLLLFGCAHQWQQTGEARDARIPVRFTHEDLRAKEVSLVADFTGWKPQMMTKSGETWSLEFPLPPGRYLYAFLVNGRTWKPDPWALLFDEDSFGKKNSVLIVE
jgi:1,4-alpha-glucan branching enzyme